MDKIYVTMVFKTSGKEQQQSSKNGKVWEPHDSPLPCCYCVEGVMWGGETQAEPWGAWLKRQTELPARASWEESRRRQRCTE